LNHDNDYNERHLLDQATGGSMSIAQTVLVFVGIPALIILVIAGLTLGPSAVRAPRYRPGSPWQYKPVWYLPHPEHSGPISELHASGGTLAVTGSVIEDPAQATGGASGEW
jgi:hypothetical protein